MNKQSWKGYAFEFLSIFIAVISAFALENWNNNRHDTHAESKILTEILNGLQKDIVDVRLNIKGHQRGIKAGHFWRKVFTGQKPNLDTLQRYYSDLTRDFISIQNTSGYETLKARGLELVKNDSLRMHIIALYEYEYNTLRKLEEEYDELQFQKNYFKEINSYIAPHFQYDALGDIIGIELPLPISQAEQNLLLSYLWKIQSNRLFILQFYGQLKSKINELQIEIEDELNK